MCIRDRLNLSKNAFQAMEKTERKELLIRLEAKGDDMICLQVSDTGCGIGDDAMQKIFEPFYTTKGSRQEMCIRDSDDTFDKIDLDGLLRDGRVVGVLLYELLSKRCV